MAGTGPSILFRFLTDTTGLSKAATDAGTAGQSAGAKMHAAFSGVLNQLNSTGVLGPFGDALNQTQQSLEQLSGHGKETSTVLMGMGAVALGAGIALQTAASSDQRAHAQLQAAVKATGNSYAQYADQIDAAVKHQTKFGDTSAQTQDALRKLTTATHDPAEALKLLSTATDLAAAKHEDLSTAAGQLGKVYNGNTKLLKEYGIEVDKHTKLTADNQTATQALANVLSGQASAAANTFSGHLADLKAKAENAFASFGTKYGPDITKFGAVMTGVGSTMKIASAAIGFFKSTGDEMSAATKVWTGVQAAFDAVMAADPIVLVILAIVALVAAIVLIATKTTWFQSIWKGLCDAMTTAFDFVKSVVMDVFHWIENYWPLLLGIIAGPIGIAAGEVVQHWQAIVDGARRVWSDITGFFSNAGSWLLGAGRDLIDGFVHGIENGIGAVVNAAKRVASAAKNAVTGFLHIFSPSEVFRDLGQQTAQGFALGVTDMTAHVTQAVTAVVSPPSPTGAATGTPTGKGRSAPAVVIETANFNSGVDLDALTRKVTFAVSAGMF
jgi:hypothetical protein